MILELFIITHPHVKLRYLLSLDERQINKTNQAIDCAYEMFPGHFELNMKKLL